MLSDLPIHVLVLGDSEKLLDGAVSSLALAVGMGMESAGGSESDVQARAQLFPKDRHEPCVSVGDDGSGQPVVLHDLLDELVCGVDGRDFILCSNNVSHLGSQVSIFINSITGHFMSISSFSLNCNLFLHFVKEIYSTWNVYLK